MPSKNPKPAKSPFRLSPLRETSACQGCPLHQHFEVQKQVTTEYYPRPDKSIDVMLIAEAPGAEENVQGRPFIGCSGQVVRRTVKRICGGPAGLAYGSVVRCRPTRPPKGTEHWAQNRPPNQKEVNCCRAGILQDIKRLKPKMIVLLGDTVAKSVARNRDGSTIDPKTKVNAMRGRDYLVRLPDGTEIPAIVTYHFSHVYRHPETTGVFREDIGKAIRRARGQLSEYHERGEKTIVLNSVPQVKKFLGHLIKNLTKADIVAFDYETTGLQRLGNKILCCGFSYRPDTSVVIPVDHQYSPWSGPELKQVKRLLRKFFRVRNPSFYSLVAHNAQFEDIVTLGQLGTHILMPIEDTRQRAHALNEDRKGVLSEPYKLKVLVEEQLGFYHYHDADIRPTVDKRNQGKLTDVQMDPLAQYNGMDAYVTYRLYRWQEQWAKADGYDAFAQVSLELHGPISRVLSAMEYSGLLADKRTVQDLMQPDSPIQLRMNELLEELYSLDTVKQANRLLVGQKAGGGGAWGSKRDDAWIYKVGSPDSKRMLFFEVLDLKPEKISRKTEKASVGKELFTKYEGVQEIDIYAEYTGLQKILSTYVKGISRVLHTDPDAHDGRVRPHFNPTGTITGRISSSNPNMLNIPSRAKTEAAKAIKRLYQVPPGWCLVVADYSQAEVRWLAEATQDQFLVKAFTDAYEAKRLCRLDPTPENQKRSKLEGDFHRHTASRAFGVALSAVTKAQRQSAKALVFGIVYGMTEQGLSSRLSSIEKRKVTVKESLAFIDQFFAQFPTAKRWLDQMEQDGFRDGFVLSPTGRRKQVSSWVILGREDPETLRGPLQRLRSFYNHEMRVCRNAPIQGVASDTNLLACSRLLDTIEREKLDWRIVNTVYDSIMLEVPFPDATRCIETAQGIMEDPDLFQAFGLQPKVPFAADFSVGVNWGDQFEIAYDSEAWDVTCRDCGVKRTEEQRPTNRRCEECGSRRVTRRIVEGPRDLLLQQIDRDHQLSACW